MLEKNMKHVLRIEKDQELNLQVSNEICCEYSLMHSAYQQSMRALIEILHQTQQFHSREYHSTTSLENALFQYSGNIIAFVAPRGGGKTRMMLSFSSILENPNQVRFCCKQHEGCMGCNNEFLQESEAKRFEGCHFFVLGPISPSALEDKQNVLYVVLSRLYRYAEELLLPRTFSNEITEQDRNDLYIAFQRCLSGINGIKRSAGDAMEDLSALQDISDGLSLRQHFYQLVQMLLKLTGFNNKKQQYLVLQFDDADSQGAQTYNTLEDIRKYLLIPNLVILMSADLNFLHSVVMQDHLKQFQDYAWIDGLQFIQDLNRITRKYIDKLIPPSHLICLPEINKIIYDDGNQLQLNYVTSNNQPALPWATGDGWNLQTTLLMLIYRKTGVAFVSPETYLHNIIPYTLRGLNQLLYLLGKMEDIPVIQKEDCSNADALAHAIMRTLPIAENNLERFIGYFTNSWLCVKITNFKDQELLNKLVKSANNDRVSLALKYLLEKYQDINLSVTTNDTENPLEEKDRAHSIESLEPSRYLLDTVLRQVVEKHRLREDYILVFSISTLLTLESHRLILRQKRDAVQSYLDSDPKKNGLLVFDYAPDVTYLPNTIDLDSKDKFDLAKTMGNDKYGKLLETCQAHSNIVSCLCGYAGSEYHLSSLMNILFLALDKKALKDADFKQQWIVYQLQEYALLIVANSDIQKRLHRMALTHPLRTNSGYSADSPVPIEKHAQDVFDWVDMCLKEMNHAKLDLFVPKIKSHRNDLISRYADPLSAVFENAPKATIELTFLNLMGENDWPKELRDRLQQIPGIGPATINKLIQAEFHLKDLTKRNLQEISKCVNRRYAELLINALEAK